MKRFLKAYRAWASASEANFLKVLIFGGFGALTVVMTLAYMCPSSPSYGAVVVDYLCRIAAIVTGVVGGAIVYHVQQYRKNHPEL